MFVVGLGNGVFFDVCCSDWICIMGGDFFCFGYVVCGW